jgi:hypothetical protein
MDNVAANSIGGEFEENQRRERVPNLRAPSRFSGAKNQKRQDCGYGKRRDSELSPN